MEANNTFESILKLIRSSNLNYHLEQTHFSAQISLKDSVIKDLSGTPLNPPPNCDLNQFKQLKTLEIENDMLLKKNRNLEKQVSDLNIDLKQIESLGKASGHRIKTLEGDLEKSVEEAVQQSEENSILKKSLKNKSEEIKNIKSELKTSHKSSIDKDKIIGELEDKIKDVENGLKTSKENFNKLKKEKRELEKEDHSDPPKYPEVAKEMMQSGFNMFHVSLKDVRSFNPNLGGFLAQNYRNHDSEITKSVQSFIRGVSLGELKHGLHFNLIGGRR